MPLFFNSLILPLFKRGSISVCICIQPIKQQTEIFRRNVKTPFLLETNQKKALSLRKIHKESALSPKTN